MEIPICVDSHLAIGRWWAQTETETILFLTYRRTSYFHLLINTFLIYFTCCSDLLIVNVEGTKKNPRRAIKAWYLNLSRYYYNSEVTIFFFYDRSYTHLVFFTNKKS